MLVKTLSSIVAASFALTFTVSAGDAFKINQGMSSVLFKTSHMQTATAWGRFNEFSGKLDFDAASPEKSTLELTVKAESVDTNNEKRDKHLRGADFFNVKEFETITFKSKSAKKVEGKTYELTGDLTMMGVTKSVTVKCEYHGLGKSPRGDGKIVGADAELKVKRSDFGMKYGIPNIGDEVTLIIAVEAVE